jgi:predicted DNA-binding protein
MPKPRSGTSYRLSGEAHNLLNKLACRLGLTKTSVLEMAIRKLAYAELGDEETAVDPRAWPRQRPSTEAFVAGHKN